MEAGLVKKTSRSVWTLFGSQYIQTIKKKKKYISKIIEAI
jgi:hypothetical protein